MFQEQIDSTNAANLQQAARITGYDASTRKFEFALQPTRTQSNLSLNAARTAPKKALQRFQNTMDSGNGANTSRTPQISRCSIPARHTQDRLITASPPPSYTSRSQSRDASCAAWVDNIAIASRPKDGRSLNNQDTWTMTPASNSATASRPISGVFVLLLVVLLILLLMYVGKRHFIYEPATHEQLGQLVMEGVCKDMSVRTCMELIKARRVGLRRW